LELAEEYILCLLRLSKMRPSLHPAIFRYGVRLSAFLVGAGGQVFFSVSEVLEL